MEAQGEAEGALLLAGSMHTLAVVDLQPTKPCRVELAQSIGLPPERSAQKAAQEAGQGAGDTCRTFWRSPYDLR